MKPFCCRFSDVVGIVIPFFGSQRSSETAKQAQIKHPAPSCLTVGTSVCADLLLIFIKHSTVHLGQTSPLWSRMSTKIWFISFLGFYYHHTWMLQISKWFKFQLLQRCSHFLVMMHTISRTQLLLTLLIPIDAAGL